MDLEYGQKLGFIQTYTKKKFFLMDPMPADFDIRDIAHALANICRFTGHVRKFYSVAEHSVRVAEYLATASQETRFCGLMHDASEAYICDMARPFKQLPEFCFYREIEAKLEQRIAEAFQLPYPLPGVVKRADEILLGTEARDLMGPCVDEWNLRYPCLGKRIRPWSPRKAERRFLDTYYRLNPFGIKKPSLFNLGPNFPWRAAA